MLSAWGDEDSAARGGEQNLSPLYSWAEPSVGTRIVLKGPAMFAPPVKLGRSGRRGRAPGAAAVRVA